MKQRMTRNRVDEISDKIKNLLDEILTEEEKSDFVVKAYNLGANILASTINRAQIVEQSSERTLDSVQWGDVKDFICTNAEKTARDYSHPNRSTRATNAIKREFHNLIGAFFN